MNDRVDPALRSAARWPSSGVNRVPFDIYLDKELYASEQAMLFKGETWNFAGLELEIPAVGDYKTGWIGDTPIVLVRSADNCFSAFVNRCAHRGATLCFDKRGHRQHRFSCVYHNWTYDLEGNLKSVAFHKGVRGQGGLPEDFDYGEHNLRKLRVESIAGLLFVTASSSTPSLSDYLGEKMSAHIRRIFNRPVRILGTYSQYMHNNWKLYMENVKDSYHASLLHLFFTTFNLNRLSQQGGVIVDDSGGHHVSYSMIDPQAAKDASYKEQGLRSDTDRLHLQDSSLLQGFDEFDDGITLQILSVFPGFVLQQIRNCLAVRQVLPKGLGRTELNWTYLGYTDDTEQQRTARLKQSNLVGPAGFISMEDGAVGGFVQRGILGAHDRQAVLEMGGDAAASSDGRATETSVRGFWKAYRKLMGS